MGGEKVDMTKCYRDLQTGHWTWCPGDPAEKFRSEQWWKTDSGSRGQWKEERLEVSEHEVGWAGLYGRL